MYSATNTITRALFLNQQMQIINALQVIMEVQNLLYEKLTKMGMFMLMSLYIPYFWKY